jgi:RNA polymerase sigma-70 factor (ECF subfamily)
MDTETKIPAKTVRSEHAERTEFDRLFRKTYGRAYSLAYRMLRNTAEAEDATQEAYLRAWRAFNSFEPSRSFEAWLLRILINLIHDRFRRLKRGGQILSLNAELDTDDGSSFTPDLADPSPSPEACLLEGAFCSQLDAALSELPELYRAAILLACVDERPYKEISITLGCPVGTVRSRVHRGREQLRKLLSSEAPVGKPSPRQMRRCK